jgi:hypothetical protein
VNRLWAFIASFIYHSSAMSRTTISRRRAVQALSAAGIAALSACRTTPPAMLPSGRITSWSVRAIRDAIRRRELSCEEVVRLHLERIASTHSTLNAVVTVRPDAALDEARSADAALRRNEAGGALHGVPMTIKDSFDTAGVLSTGWRSAAYPTPVADAGLEGLSVFTLETLGRELAISHFGGRVSGDFTSRRSQRS